MDQKTMKTTRFRVEIEVTLPEEGFRSPLYQQARLLAAEFQTRRQRQGFSNLDELSEAKQCYFVMERQRREWLFDPLTAAAATLMKVKFIEQAVERDQ